MPAVPDVPDVVPGAGTETTRACVRGNAVLSPSLLQQNMLADVRGSLPQHAPSAAHFPQSCWDARCSLMWPTLAHQQPPRQSSRWRAAGSACPTPMLMWSWWRLWVSLLASRNLPMVCSDPPCWWVCRHPQQASAGGGCPISSVPAVSSQACEGAPAVLAGTDPMTRTRTPHLKLSPAESTPLALNLPSAGEECYIALDKGAITDQHVLVRRQQWPCSSCSSQGADALAASRTALLPPCQPVCPGWWCCAPTWSVVFTQLKIMVQTLHLEIARAGAACGALCLLAGCPRQHDRGDAAVGTQATTTNCAVACTAGRRGLPHAGLPAT